MAKVIDVESQQQKHPLLLSTQSKNEERTQQQRDVSIQNAINQTFKSTAHLANLLPTGTVLIFQLLSPVFTNDGHCSPASRPTSAFLVGVCALSCFLLSFTDSFQAPDGTIRHGIATPRGLWVLDGDDGHCAELSPEKMYEFRLRLIDFLHAFASVLVFAAIAMLDKNVVGCFYPTPTPEMKELLISIPVGIGVFCSMLFVAFPTKRHGIGFPHSSSP